MCGDASVVIAGGQESMSLAPHVVQGARTGKKMGDFRMLDTMIRDGLWCNTGDYHVGTTAENVAEKYGVTRTLQDEYAVKSQSKAAVAQEVGTVLTLCPTHT